MFSVPFVFISLLSAVLSFDSKNIVFVIVSQDEPYHASVASRLKTNIENQIYEIEERLPIVHLSHEDFPVPGGWTIVPLLQPLFTRYGVDDVRWLVFLEAHTAVRAGLLVKALAESDSQDTLWVGYPLSDEEPTIIHHFSIREDLEDEGGLAYPNFASGFAMKMKLVKELLQSIERNVKQDIEFSIDPAFELAQSIYLAVGKEGLLTPDLRFCVVSGDGCATYPRQYDSCGAPVDEKSILFAVKTWSGFHSTRARVVKKTWGKHVTNIMFYSNVNDSSLPSIDVGVPNTKTGHCAKTMAILKLVSRKIKDAPEIKWVFLADDDTILGVSRLCEVLSCLRGGEHLTLAGERYGYGYGAKKIKGYDFVTGGGGTVLSAGAAASLASCACASLAAPDDMALGACARHRAIPVLHYALFHQNRPQDYASEYLARDRPVSFHRHSSPDPLRVYSVWFKDYEQPHRIVREEL